MSMSDKGTDKQKPIQNFAKYAGLGMQLFVSMAVAAYIGQKLDAKMDLGNDYITIVLVMLVFVAIMYKVIKELT